MFGKKTLVTAAIAATALMSPAAALAKGGDSGSGHNSSSKSTYTAPTAPAECATIDNVTTDQGIRYDVWGQPDAGGMHWIDVYAQATNCGTETESLQWNAKYTNLNTGIQEFADTSFSTPVGVAPGGSINMAVGDSVANTLVGKSYRFDLTVKSATTGKILAQKSVYATIQ